MCTLWRHGRELFGGESNMWAARAAINPVERDAVGAWMVDHLAHIAQRDMLRLVTGVDFAGVALARAAQLAEQADVAPRVTWVQAEVSDSSTWGASFDLVMVACLHPVSTERRSVLTAAARS